MSAHGAQPLCGNRAVISTSESTPAPNLTMQPPDPDGIAGEAIPLEARIVALADAVDAMRRPKVKRAAPLTHPEIAEEVARGRETQFDPARVDAFLALLERGELGL